MQRRQFICTTSAAALGTVAVPWAHAQADYPNRPIRWIVPYLAGTAPDQTVRPVADAMAEILKQPVVVDNKAGAAGNIGAQLAVRAPADGYTWVYSAAPMATNMRMYKKPGFDTMKDLVHIGRIAQSDLCLVVHPDSGFNKFAELAERLRQQPGKLSYASGGIGTPAHMAAALLLGQAQLDALHVPYKGASESAAAVIGRQVDFALTITSVSNPHVTGGRLRALAVTAPQRNPKLPQVPTVSELGLSGATVVSFGGLSVPAGTPAAVQKRLEEALAKALAIPEVRAKLEAQGGLVSPAGSAEYTEVLRAEIALTERMMRAANLEPQ